MKTCVALSGLVVGLCLGTTTLAWAEAISVAVLDFDATQAKGVDDHLGALLADLLSAQLSHDEDLRLVERQVLKKALQEQALDLSGLVDPQGAATVSKLTGAQVLVAGRAFTVQRKLLVTARLITTATGQVHTVLGEGIVDGDLSALVSSLSEQIRHVLMTQPLDGASSPPAQPDALSGLASALLGKRLPRMSVHIHEMFLGVESKASVVEAQLVSLLLGLHAEITQPSGSTPLITLEDYLQNPSSGVLDHFAPAEVVVLGEAKSELGLRNGDLISATGRVKCLAIDLKTTHVLASHELEERALDVTPKGAAEKAMSEATRKMAQQFIPAVVQTWNDAHHHQE